MTTGTFERINWTTCDAQHHQPEQNLSSLIRPETGPSIRHLTPGQRIGLVLAAEASGFSFVCVLAILVVFARNILRHRKAIRKGGLKLLGAPTDIYMFSLFMFDIIQATGGVLSVRWVHDGQVRTGPYCTAQGIIKQMGAVGIALITLILAVHTIIAALWGIGIEARGVAFSVVGLTYVYIALGIGISNLIHKDYEAPAPYWCWISSRFPVERLAESICLWTALFGSVVVYIPLHFWAKGRLEPGDRWYKFHLSRPDQNVEYTDRRVRLGILFYPLGYSLVVLPITIARWSHKNQSDIPSAALFFGQFTLGLSGAINVLLFLTTRHQLLLFNVAPLENPVEIEAQVPHRNTGPLDTVQCERRAGPETKGMKRMDDSDSEEKSSTFMSDESYKSESLSRNGSVDDI